MINVDKVTKKFDDFTALDEMTLNIKSGSAYGLLGSNGAGKSTLLRILAGIYKQDKGSVTIDGNTIYDNVEVKQKVFYVSDDVLSDIFKREICKAYESDRSAAEQAYVNIFKGYETAGGCRVRTCGIDRYTSAGRGF